MRNLTNVHLVCSVQYTPQYNTGMSFYSMEFVTFGRKKSVNVCEVSLLERSLNLMQFDWKSMGKNFRA